MAISLSFSVCLVVYLFVCVCVQELPVLSASPCIAHSFSDSVDKILDLFLFFVVCRH
mgnify:CR=1 FL=1